jgi:hypothetical protein
LTFHAGEHLPLNGQRIEVNPVGLCSRDPAHGDYHLLAPLAPVDGIDLERLREFGFQFLLGRLVLRGVGLAGVGDEVLRAADHHPAVVVELNGADAGRALAVLRAGEDGPFLRAVRDGGRGKKEPGRGCDE